jgi:hypothetical protein
MKIRLISVYNTEMWFPPSKAGSFIARNSPAAGEAFTNALTILSIHGGSEPLGHLGWHA